MELNLFLFCMLLPSSVNLLQPKTNATTDKNSEENHFFADLQAETQIQSHSL